MYRCRLYPSNIQQERLLNNFEICKSVYNELLELRIKTYKETKKSLSKFDCDVLLKGRYKGIVFSQVLQNVSDRVDKSFKNFFRRVKDKSCRKKGFPRFKSQVHSITYSQFGFKMLSDKRLHLSTIGNIPIILHRLPKGKIKTLTAKRNRANQWFACFACEVEIPKVKHPSKKQVGIDVGIENLATLSDGNVIENPRFLIKSEKRLKRLQRRLNRKVKGSANRQKAKLLVARQHLKIDNQRIDFLHKLSHELAKKYSVIKIESLNINGMVRNHHLAKHILDASWNSFFRMLSYKAVTGGGQLVEVNPRGTSRTCSNCGTLIDMPLSKRTFKCTNCGFVCHRDLNASININGSAGLARTYTPMDTKPPQQNNSVASSVDEVGTTCKTPQLH